MPFHSGRAQLAFDSLIGDLAAHFAHEYPDEGIDWVTEIRSQIFDNEWVLHHALAEVTAAAGGHPIPADTLMTRSLFRLFVGNAANRSGGAVVRDWTMLRSLFRNWDPVQVALRYPIAGGCPHPELLRDLLDEDLRLGIIGGKIDYHRDRIAQGLHKNSWVRLLIAAQRAAPLFTSPTFQAARTVHYKLVALCNHVDLSGIPIAQLQTDNLWEAIAPLREIPEIGAQLALNYLKDAGIEHAVKPDIHLRRVLGYACSIDGDAYRPNDQGERACASVAIEFVQALALSCPAIQPTVNLAVIDRLLWLTGSGRLFVGRGQVERYRLSRRLIIGRSRQAAARLRTALL